MREFSRSLTYDEIRMWLQLGMFVMCLIFFLDWLTTKLAERR